MIKVISVFVLACLLSACSDQPSSTIMNDVEWNQHKRKTHLKNRVDATTWDHQMFEDDKQLIGIGDIGPFEIGIFPVPKYESLGQGSFKGLNNINEVFSINTKKITMNSFFVKSNALNESKLGDAKDELFFQILVLTDTIDNENYNLNKCIAISRNHPDYLGQGFIQTKNNKIEYFAFATAEENAYAIINSRIFDLSYGQTILIAPQKDKTLRSLQLSSPSLTSDAIINYTNNLITEKNVFEFFNTEGSI